MINAAVLAMLCTAAVAKVIHVPSDAPTIQAGIDLAADGDEVVVADGVYTGGGNRDIDFSGKLITVRSEHGPQQCIIDCQGTIASPHRGVYFRNGETAAAMLDGFTIRNGSVGNFNPGPGGTGGGIRCDGSSPTIANCIITACESIGHDCGASGGGIYSSGGSPAFLNCIISDNHSQGTSGGGLYCSAATLIGCTITNNTVGCTGWGSGHGGGISGSNLTLVGCHILGNSAVNSAGGVSASAATIINCRILSNQARSTAGGLSVTDGLIANCVIADNHTTSNTFSGGGGIWCGGSTTISTCTVVYNSSGTGGGIRIFSGIVKLHNSIVWGNEGSQGTQVAVTMFHIPAALTVAYCDIQPGPSDVFIGNGAQLILGAGNTGTDPMFVDGGLDHHLMPGSPCIDAGWNNAAMFDTADLDGNPRFADDPATKDSGCGAPVIVDMGAYEYPGKEGTVVFGDVNGDGALRINDLPALALCLGSDDPACCVADLDLDGAVGPSDQALLLASLLDFISGK